jgi:hypothetical protein
MASGIANLGSGEVVTGSESGRVFVERRLSILMLRVIRKMWEAEKARLFRFTLLLEVARIHGGLACSMQ